MYKTLRLIASVLISVIHLFAAVAVSGTFSEKQYATVTIENRQDLNRLTETGIIISGVRETRVSVYINESEYLAIKAMGYPVIWLPHAKPVQKAGGSALTYPSYEELQEDLQAIVDNNPDICRIESAGKSVQDRDLWWVRITDLPDEEEAEPEVHVIGSMHGDEPAGAVLCIELIRYLADNYTSDARVKALVDSTELWIMPLMNPDGYSTHPRSRLNADGIDLNRDFPDPSANSGETYDSTSGRAPETIAVMDWSLTHTPVLSANVHTGALVVNYPFDYSDRISLDEDLFQAISKEYSFYNTPMYTNSDIAEAEFGVIRGAVWYQAYGTMQDWASLATGGYQVTVEVSGYDVKEPPESELEDLWNDNRESMLAYLETAQWGIHGVVNDQVSGDPVSARIIVEGKDNIVYTDPDAGDYHRMLLPGTYNVTVCADGYLSTSVQGIVVESGTPTLRDISLEPGTDPEPSGDSGLNWPDTSTATDGNQGSSHNGDDPDGTGGDTSPEPPAPGDENGGCFIGASWFSFT